VISSVTSSLKLKALSFSDEVTEEMGIPSFYRHLCKRHPELISRDVKETEWLALDFNCAMYHVLHKMPDYDPDQKAAWEKNFRKEICAYLMTIVDLVNPKGVYVSCDGVVCAAKRRQQRLRRFKGPWVSAIEDSLRGSTKVRWDQNALTPGTAFMASLGKDLVKTGSAIQKRGIPCIVSTTEEPGEGEHKLMRHLRGLDSLESCVIYGLDADLLLLAMLLVREKGIPVHLLREAQEFEQSNTGWCTVDVPRLIDVLLPSHERVDDFVAAMSLLGNDFVPKSLTHTVRDDGIPGLIQTMKRVLWSQGRTLIVSDKIDGVSLRAIVTAMASEEEQNLVKSCVGAIRSRNRQVFADSAEEQAVAEWQASPSRWATILSLYDSRNRCLKSAWKTIYASWCPDASGLEYLATLSWVYDYYKGRPVDLGWAYEPHLPPLWSDLIESIGSNIDSPPLAYEAYLPAWVHLLAVLPETSAKALLKKSQLTLMKSHPLYWPTQFSLFDVGASQIWQTEAVIPTIPETVLRDQR
jgi:5'-3' exonuclease